MVSDFFSHPSRCIFIAAALLGTANGGLASGAQPRLRGAEAIMAEWPAPSSASSLFKRLLNGFSGSQSLQKEIVAFRKNASTLTEAQAAQTWLDLVDSFFRRSSNSGFSSLLREPEDLPRFEAVLAALPPVKAWSELSARIKLRPIDEKSPSIKELMLKLLGARLADDGDEQAKIQAQLKSVLKGSRWNQGPTALENFLRGENRGSMAALENFVREIDSYQPPTKDAGGDYTEPAYSPDLVSLVGEEKAELMIEKALLSPVPEVNFNKGELTQRLASACAVKVIDRITIARWNLSQRLGSPTLFEALEQRFGPPKREPATGSRSHWHNNASSSSSEYEKAYGYHILNLVIAERSAEAVSRALAPNAPQSERLLQAGAELLGNRGHAQDVADFLHGVLSQKPELPWWGTYVAVAARAGQSSKALRTLQATLTKPALSASEKQTIGQHLAEALLADDQVDNGVTELLRVMNATELPAAEEQVEERRKDAAHKLMKLGNALDQKDWTDKAASALVTFAKAKDDYWEKASIAQALVKAKRYLDAETLLGEALKKELKDQTSVGGSYASSNVTSLLIDLANLYQKAGYDADVIALLDRAPYWGAADLADIQSYNNRDTAFAAASQALVATGSIERAIPIVRSLVKIEPGSDQGYQLWFKTSPRDLEPQLDALALEDPFQERPLIWKAELLRTQGRFNEAEKACRAAIAIDPSDGEQPAGDRLRAYAVLAEVRAAQGDAEQAATYRKVIQAIRLSERADELFHAGLLKRAIALYEEALSLFSDAYCIQSRLAIRLAEAGRLQEAEEHYRRAYELMPDSFGRVESHCFGCEHAFGPENAQAIAERVFTQFVEKNPTKPQVHYLLGFLRSEQDRPKEALTHYQEAARLDPDYLNAWKKIDGLNGQLDLPQAELDLALENILRLDPQGKHSAPSIDKVRDLKILFRHADSPKTKAAELTAVYPLKASAALLAKSPKKESFYSDFGGRITRDNIARNHDFFELLTSLASEALYPGFE